ncbi:MAG: Calx-beta domain-containing protein [Acidimicrobiia bacterium]
MLHSVRRGALLLVIGVLGGMLPAGVAPASGLDELSSPVCGALRPIQLPSGHVACTHGADPAPEGVDISVPFEPGKRRAGLLLPDPPTGSSAEAQGPGGIRCYDRFTDGNRVQVVYARPSNRPDRYDRVLNSIKTFTAETDEIFNASAARYGATRHVRFVTDKQCELSVANVVLSPLGDDTLDTTIAELAARGYDDPHRKYLVFMDSTELCGIAAYYPENQADANNANNGPDGVPGLVARVDSGCWGLAFRGESIEAHELMHSLGSVLPAAPHATARGHCQDESDRMCYSDFAGVTTQDLCSEDDEALFDCGGDDYFNPAPAPGSYLAGAWNTAFSSFLTSRPGDPTISVSDAVVGEGDAGTKYARFTVSLGSPTSEGVSVRYVSSAGTAQKGTDYLPVEGIVGFGPGDTRATVSVPVMGDDLDEQDENFSLALYGANGGPLLDSVGVARIVDDDPKRVGYRLVASDGGIFAFGEAPFYGSTGSIRLNRPINGMAATPSGAGYWMVASDGGLFSFGDAGFFGSAGGMNLADPVVGMTPTGTGQGYRLATAGGEVFSYGDAARLPEESLGQRPAEPIVGIAGTPSGAGYWLAGRDGTVTAFGDAADLGSTGPLNQPVVAIAATPTGAGFWLVASDGGIFAFGDALFYGSTGGVPLNKPVVGMASSATGEGYWLVASDGGIFAFGDADFAGSTGGIALNQPVVGMTSVR